jgi:hypothetical protein
MGLVERLAYYQILIWVAGFSVALLQQQWRNEKLAST